MRAGGPVRLFERLTALAPGFRGECDAWPSGRCAVSAGTGHFHGDPVPDMPRLNVGLDQGLYGSDFPYLRHDPASPVSAIRPDRSAR
jgi:hypothetical protein